MATPSADPPTKRRLDFRLVPEVLFHPRKAFGGIVALGRPSWLTPLLILSLTALLPVLVLGRIRQQGGAFGPESLPPDFQYYTPDQQAQFMTALESTRKPAFVYILPGVGALATVWIGWLVTGAVLHLSSTILGGRTTSADVLNFAGWAGLPFAVRWLVRAGFIAAAGRGLTGPGLSGFIGTDAAGALSFLRQVLATVDIYLIWHLVLLGIGLAALGGLSRRKVILAVALTEIVAILLQAIPAAVSASLADLTIIRPFFF